MVLQAVEITRDALEATVALNRLAWHGLQLEEPATPDSSAGSNSKAQVESVSPPDATCTGPLSAMSSLTRPPMAAEAQGVSCL